MKLTLKKELGPPSAGLTGFEPPITEVETNILDAAHRFAKDVLRPAGRELDRMDAAQVVAPGSPFYAVLGEAARIHRNRRRRSGGRCSAALKE